MSLSTETHAALALCRREILKFFRDRSRLFGAFAQPIGFWLLLGLGFQGAFQMPGASSGDTSYLEFLFPGIITLMLLFTAIFSTISIIEDRKSGFLQAGIVAPVTRPTLVLGAVLGGTVLALGQALLFFVMAPWVGLSPSITGLALAVLVCFFLGLAFTALGFAMAWRSQSTRGFHAVMNVVLFPLWILSGGFFPVAGASGLLRWMMLINPVTYGVEALRRALYLPAPPTATDLPLPAALSVTVVFALAMLLFALQTIRRSIVEVL